MNPVVNILSDLLKNSKTLNVQDPTTGRIYTKQTSELKKPPEDVILLHLQGIRRIGISPWIETDKVLFGAVDLDLGELPEEDRKKHALEVYEKLTKLGFKPFIEKSKGKGYHVWLFFSEPVNADTVSWVLDKAKQACSYTDKRKLELFPPKKTPLFLPLFGSMKSDGDISSEFIRSKKNAFLKPENLNQFFSNWFNYFQEYAVENVKTLNLLEKLKTLPPCFLRAYENWRQGNRNGYTAGLAGVCKNILKLTEEEAEEIILSIAKAKGDDELKQREAVIYQTYEKDSVAACAILKGKHAEITVDTPVCEGDCELVEKLKRKEKKHGRQIITLSKFYPAPFGDLLLERFSFWYEGKKRDFWVYDEKEGIWKSNAEDFIEGFLYTENLLDPTLKKKHQVSEIVEYVKYHAFHKGKSLPQPSPFLIPFKNGVYDLKTNEFRPFRKSEKKTTSLLSYLGITGKELNVH